MKDIKVALQLYSVRENMKEDMDATLKAVKEMGYDYVEFAGYFEKSAEEVKALLDKHSLKCISVHQTYDVFLAEPEKNVQFLKTIGAEFCAVPWMASGNLKGEKFEKTVEDMKKVSALLRENGIKFRYHNHDFEFVEEDGKVLIDKLFEGVGRDNIGPEFDTGWVTYAGYNPVEYIEKYKELCQIVHLKDFNCKRLKAGPNYALIDKDGKEIKPVSAEDNAFVFKPLGQGRLDVPAILDICRRIDTECVVVEQDNFEEGLTPLEAVKISREYLKTLGL